jgi:hypothetical protein
MLSNTDEMNIKQLLGAIDTALTSISNRLTSRFQRPWPTSDEIENNKVKSLANRLKAGSYKETLTNILEWQDRNIKFWIERWQISRVFIVSIVTVFLVIPFFILPYSQTVWWIITILASIATTTFSILVVLLKYFRKTPIWDGLKNVFAESTNG